MDLFSTQGELCTVGLSVFFYFTFYLFGGAYAPNAPLAYGPGLSFPNHQGPYGGDALRSAPQVPITSLHCQTTDTRIVHRVVGLFTPQFSLVPYYTTWLPGQVGVNNLPRVVPQQRSGHHTAKSRKKVHDTFRLFCQ